MSDLSANEIWDAAKRELGSVLSRDVYDRYIALIDVQRVDNDVLFLGVANDFYQYWLEENYLSLIQDAVSASSGLAIQVRFEVVKVTAAPAVVPAASVASVPEEATGVKAAVAKKAPRTRKVAKKNESIDRGQMNKNYTFDSFVVGPSNNFAHAACLAVAQAPAKAYNPLFLYGGVGLGKTHLMQAIGHYVLDSRQKARVSCVTTEFFVNEYIESIRKNCTTDFRNKYRGVDVLLIDDIHFLGGKEQMQEEFFHTFNALMQNHRQIVLTSDRPASEIPGLAKRLVSRFEWGLTADLETPDEETRVAILRKKRELLNLDVKDDVIKFIAQRVRSNVRRLEGALIRASSYSSLTGEILTLDNVERTLRGVLEQEQTEVLSCEKIQRAVSDYYDVRIGDLCGSKRPNSIAFPRQVAMYLCRTLTDHSFPEIGSAFGRKHATVLHACKSVTSRMEDDGDLRQAISSLSQKLGC